MQGIVQGSVGFVGKPMAQGLILTNFSTITITTAVNVMLVPIVFVTVATYCYYCCDYDYR